MTEQNMLISGLELWHLATGLAAFIVMTMIGVWRVIEAERGKTKELIASRVDLILSSVKDLDVSVQRLYASNEAALVSKGDTRTTLAAHEKRLDRLEDDK